MKIRSILTNGFLMLALVAASQPAFAGEVKDRELNQQARIGQGVTSGQLTPGETAHLEKGEQNIQNARAKALADGKLTPKEKARLNRKENKESKKIYRAKHNAKKLTPAPATT